MSADQVKALILDCLRPAVHASIPAAAADDFDVRAEGVVDSLGFIQLVTALEERLGIALDLSDLDPDRLTVLGPLSRAIADQVNGSHTD